MLVSSTSDDVTVGRRLQAVRQRRDLTQQAFADSLGVSLRTYQNYERGDRPASKDLLCALLERYEVDLAWLLTGKEGTNARSATIDDELLKKVIRALRSEESQLRGLDMEHLLGYVITVYNEVCGRSEADRNEAITSAVRLLSEAFERRYYESLVANVEQAELEQILAAALASGEVSDEVSVELREKLCQLAHERRMTISNDRKGSEGDDSDSG